MFAFFKKIVTTVNNSVRVNGNNNHILNIVNTDKTSYSYDPQIDWNVVPQAGAGLSAQLEWRTRLTRIIGRDSEQKVLLDWANEAPQLSFKIIEAPGGTGKTRLAAEVAQTLSDSKDWSAGFVQLLDFEKGQRLQWQGNWLIVIDYPEHAPERLESLFRIAKAGLTQQNNCKLRVLLLCRSKEGIAAKLDDAGSLGFLSPQLDLKELPAQDNFELLTLALAKLPQENSPTVDRAAFDDWQQQSPLHQTALFVLALALHLSTPGEKQQFLPGKDLLLVLVQREKKRWKKAEEGLDLQPSTLADVIAFATLFNGLPAADVNTVLRQHYGWSDDLNRKVLTALSEVWHADISNDTVYPTLAPDLLAAAFLWDWQSQTSKRGNTNDGAIICKLTEARSATTYNLLQRWNMVSYDQTVRLGLGRQPDVGSLCRLLVNTATNNSTFSERLLSSFNSTSLPWTELSQLVKYCGTPKQLVDDDDLLKLANHAADLQNHAVRLSASGDSADSLTAALDAVEIYTRLAKVQPVVFEPSLAVSLNTLANSLSLSGDRAGALNAVLKAVEIYARLAKVQPAVFEPNWAMSLITLANSLSESGDRAGALNAALKAVEIYARLAKAQPAVFEPHLATSLNNLSVDLRESGEHARALTANKLAVEIRRRLAESQPAVFEPDLASSVNNLANRLSESGDLAGALLASKEAVEIYTRLAKAQPAVFEPDLAKSVNNLAVRLSESGDLSRALLAAKEAVEIRRRLAKAQPVVFMPNLAISLHNLAIDLNESGDCAGALAAAEEAVALFESSNMRHKGLFEEHIKNGRALVESLNKQI